MAIQDSPYKTALTGLYQEMAAAPMDIEVYAEKLAKITDTQILTGEVTAGISVSTTGSESAQTGKTTEKGKLE
jgi:hypothetical protein